MKRIFLLFLVLATWAQAATTWYLDSSNGGTHNGTSWATAWSDVSQITGVAAGDTIYISGGASGGSQTYTRTTYWVPPSGSSGGGVVKLQIGQDSAHNGTAIFNATSSANWITGMDYFYVSGDAGDGNCHIKLTGSFYAMGDNCSHTRVSYVEADTLSGLSYAMIWTSSATGMEFDHNLVKITDLTTSDYALSLGTQDTSFDVNKIHDNYIQVPVLFSGLNSNGGNGCDVIQGGSGVSVYNNTLEGYNAAYTPGQHADGWQCQSGNYLKFYKNTIINIPNYGVYGDARVGGFTHFWVYDNLFVVTASTMQSGSAVVIGVDGGYIGSQPCPFTDVIIANNLQVNYGTGNGNTSCYSCNNGTAFTATFTGVYVVNNCAVDGASSIDTTGNTGSTYSGNTFITNAAAPSNFTSYTRFAGTANDYHLTSGATSMIGVGTDMSAYYTTDFAGTTWSTWSSGIYYYNAGASAPLFSSASVPTSGASISIVFDQSCTTGGGGAAGMSVTASGGAVTLSYSSGSGSSTYVYNTSRTINSGETVSNLSYVQPGSGIAGTTGSIDVASFSGKAVTNNSTQGGGGTGGSALSGKIVLTGKVSIK